MKRRNMLMASAASLALPVLGRTYAMAQSAPDASRLNGELTPLGAERAASASGYVPAWTGGVTAPPADWKPGDFPPDFFADEKPIFTVTADNMDKYAAMLSDGQKVLLKKYSAAGYRMDVFPSHRTHCAPQWVYDETAKNVTRAQPAADGGIKFGFSGAFAGPPFPIPSDDPALAGAQIIWNHVTRWQGVYYYTPSIDYVVGNGQRSLTAGARYSAWSPYYDRENADFFPTTSKFLSYSLTNVAPANQVGGKFMVYFSANLAVVPDVFYEYLVGEGRIRLLPGTEYDIPAPEFSDLVNYDEVFLFSGKLDRYDWKLIGKQEMIVPYNLQGVLLGAENLDDIMGLQFVNPDSMRYEIHRCWVVEARLTPGKRHSEPLRRFYIDEDSWIIMTTDGYDDQGNYWKFGQNLVQCLPEMPGVRAGGFNYHNVQSESYILQSLFYKAPAPLGGPVMTFEKQPRSDFEPQAMANSGSL